MHTETTPKEPVLVHRDLVMEAPPTLVFDHSLSFLCSFPPTRGEQTAEAGTLTKALAIDGRAALVRVRDTRHGLAGSITSRGALSAGACERLLARVRFQLSLDDDLAPFRALASDDAAFAPVARRWAGHHHVKFPSLFEIAAWAVLAQRNQRLGRRMKDALVAALGPRLVVEGVRYEAFPEPGAVRDARGLGEIVGGAANADALQVLARTFSDPAVERMLLGVSIDQAEAFLRELPRIGSWSAAFILFRGLGRMERLAARTGPIVEAARRVYGPRTEREVRAIAEAYGPWCGYWALYLRRS